MIAEEVAGPAARVAPGAGEEAGLYHEQLRLLYENLPPGLVVTAINAALLATMEWHAVPRVRVGVWALAMLVITLGRYRLTAHYRAAPAAHDDRAWGRYYTVATLLAGIGWGLAALILFPAGLLPQIFLFFMLTTMTVGAVVSFAALFPVALAFVAPILGPLALRLFLLPGAIHHAMGFVALVFMAVMLLTTRRIEGTIAASLRLRFENQDLIVRLEGEKGAIHRLNAALTREIAVRSQTAAELQQRESYIRAVLEHVDEGIVTLDERGTLRSLNREALRIFGYREEDLVGCHFSHLVPPAERSEYTRFLENEARQPSRTLSGHGLEVNGLRHDGTVFPMELGLSAMTVGAERQFVAVTRDVSARKRGDRLKSELVAALSHELKTPLTAALGSLGLLTEVAGNRLTGDGPRLLRMAKSNLDRLARTVRDLLDVDNNEIATTKWAPLPVLLPQLAADAAAADAEYAAAREVRLAADPCSSACVAQGDRPLLLRALSHLIVTAIHLAPAHTTVEIAVATEAGYAIISVRDCGTALPAEARRGLFDAEPRLADFGITAPRGLYLARVIAEKHGGSVGYESRDAGGSHFFLRLPLYAAP